MSDLLQRQLPVSFVYGQEEVALDDPAEQFHEASKLQPSLRLQQGAGILRITLDEGVRDLAEQGAARRHPQRPVLGLPAVEPDVLLARGRSAAGFEPAALRLATLAALLHAGYGVTEDGRRTIPSGGALYPLELYPVAQRVDGLDPAVYHYDASRHELGLVRAGDPAAGLAATAVLPEAVENAAAVVFVAAVLWRTRFKYGLRGYRFALLEAGHCVQNVLLAAHARGVRALPLGGYYDSRAEHLLGVDGVEEAVVYAVALGGESR